jgi:hypothetical protein
MPGRLLSGMVASAAAGPVRGRPHVVPQPGQLQPGQLQTWGNFPRPGFGIALE